MPRKIDAQSFIDRAKAIHGDRYGYDGMNFLGMKIPVELLCREIDHGAFMIRPADHVSVRAQGCPKCGKAKSIRTRTKGLEAFIEQARKVHGDQYDYSRFVYVNALTKGEIIDRSGRSFWQTPANHLSGHGSVHERNDRFADQYRWTKEEFVRRAMEVHKGFYSYPDDYHGAHIKTRIECPKHGSFMQVPQCHIALGQGCPRCSNAISSDQNQIMQFLESMSVQFEINDRKILNGLELDIWMPDRKLAIEYCGLYHHSEYSKKDHLYHVRKHDLCEGLGIRLITIFGDEWHERKLIVEEVLRHLVGQSPRGVDGRKARIDLIEWAVAKPLLDQHHLLGAGPPSKTCLGAYSREGELIAAMTFGNPNNEQGRTDQIEMRRFVTDGRNHPGLGSRMFAEAIRRFGYKSVTAFVDRRWYTGSFKAMSGFVVNQVVPPSLWWTDHRKRFHRRFMSREEAIEMSGVAEDSTKLIAMNQLGYYRIWDCGKLRLEWTA